MSLVEMHPLRKDKSLSDGTPVMSTSVLGSRLSFTNHEGSTSVYPASVHGFFSKVLVHSYHLSQIVDIYIHIAAWAVLFSLRDAIRDKLFKENALCRFPYQENTLNQWFIHNVSNRDLHPTGTISMLNLNEKSDQYPKLNGAVYQPSPRGAAAGFTVLCHGTDHQSAKNIIKGGILLGRVRKNGDFSDRKGFYLTEFESALRWASWKFRIRKPKKIAVLVFRIQNEEIDKKYRPKSLNLVGKENEKYWKEFVTSEDIADKTEGKTFVEGPWMRRQWDGEKTCISKPNTYQMCIFDPEMAKMMNRCLHSVVFYDIIPKEDGE